MASILLVGLLAMACANSAPLSVERAPIGATRRSVSVNVMSTGELSEPTLIVLRRHELVGSSASGEEGAIAALHAKAAAREAGSDEYFALAELSFYRAEHLSQKAFRQARWRDERRRRGAKHRPPPYHDADWAIVARAQQDYFAAAIYAFTFIFSDDEIEQISPIDPRIRIAADLYNRSLALAFQNKEGFVALKNGRFSVPFGIVDVAFDQADRIWGDRYLVDFIPSDEFLVEGLNNRYRRPGVGAPLAARTLPIDESDPAGYLVAKNAVVSTTAFLLIDDPRGQLEGDRIAATLRVTPWSEQENIAVGRWELPLEAQPSAALAASLEESTVWQSKFGIFLGRITRLDDQNRLFGWEPRLPGQIPVVFVHGTMSTPVIWANMVNDLQSDPLIRDRYQFLFYAYESGNPLMYSSMLFRRSLERAREALDPSGQDACLRKMVLAGHSQGGLLIKAQVIDSGSVLWDSMFDVPLEETGYNENSKAVLREAAFLEPDPFVEQVIFLSTPHRGSYVAASAILRALAARAIQFPGDLTALAVETAGLEYDGEAGRTLRVNTSIDNMSPNSPSIQALGSIPVAPSVHAHSIISVKGDGPVEEGDDGVVKYTSAHIDEAESELVVRSGHKSYLQPKAIEEVRRILREYAESVNCDIP